VSFVFLSIILRKEQHKHERCYYIYHVALLCSISSVTSRSWQSICMLQEKGTWMLTEPRTKLVNSSVSPNGRGELVTSAIAVVMMSGIGCVVSPIPSLINLAFGFFWMCSCSRMDIWLRGPEEWKQSVSCQWLRSIFRIKKKKNTWFDRINEHESKRVMAHDNNNESTSGNKYPLRRPSILTLRGTCVQWPVITCTFFIIISRPRLCLRNLMLV
jgi:hypothetical protein